MPTGKPRLMITVSDEMRRQIDDYRFAHRCKSTSQALNELIERGIEVLNPQPTAEQAEQPVTMDELSELEVEFMETFDALTEQNQRLLLGIGALILQEQQKPPD